jgi:hypothetical protein
MPLSDIYAQFADRADVLKQFLARLNARAAGMTAVDASAPARDRAFDAIMQIFDAAGEDKPLLRVLARDLPRDPITLVSLWPRIEQILEGVLDRAALPLAGALSPLRTLGLAGILLRIFSTWLDDGPEQAKTMATLDGDLRRIESLLGHLSPSRPAKSKSNDEGARDTLH